MQSVIVSLSLHIVFRLSPTEQPRDLILTMAACADGSCAARNLSREEKRREFEHHVAEAAETRKGLRENLISIGLNYIIHSSGADEMEEQLRDVWDELIHAARTLPAESPELDRLVTLVLEVRELGLIGRVKSDAHGREDAVLPNGQRLWSDLPYLAHELQDSWANESTGFTVRERTSLAALTAKLCAVGVCAADVALCGLWLFKEALETDRPPSDGGDTGQGPWLLQLLPACLEWLSHGSYKMAMLSADNHLPTRRHLTTAPGPLAVQANVTGQGFSMDRWLFWRRRLGELYLGGVQGVSEPARKAFEIMVGSGLAVGIDVAGEKEYLAKVFEALDAELAARGNKGSVDAEEIRIDPLWAEQK